MATMGRTERKKHKWFSPLRVTLTAAKARAKQKITRTLGMVYFTCFTTGVVSFVKKVVSVVMKGL